MTGSDIDKIADALLDTTEARQHSKDEHRELLNDLKKLGYWSDENDAVVEKMLDAAKKAFLD